MRTEEFDDIIKNKLESISPLVSDKEAERIHAYTLKNRSPFSLMKTNRFLWAIIGMGMVATAVVTWQLARRYPREAQAAQRLAAPAPKTIVKTDTVYVREKEPANHAGPTALIAAARGTANQHIASLAFGSRKTHRSQAGFENNGAADYARYGTAAQQQQANISYGTNAARNSNTHNSDKTGEITGQNPVNEQNGGNATAQDAKAQSPAPKGSPSANKAPEDSTAPVAQKTPVHNYADAHKSSVKPKTPAPHLGIMAGIGFEGANTQMGAGAFAKLYYGHWALNTGLKFMDINNQSYKTNTDFKDAKGYSFNPPNLPAGCWVSDINIKYNLWQVPLSLEYDWTLNNRLSFSLATGTDFDINCSSGIGYQEVDYSGSYSSQSMKKTYKPVVFNDWVLSPGVVWQMFPKMAVQLNAFGSYEVKEAYYKGPDKIFGGADIKLFYTF